MQNPDETISPSPDSVELELAQALPAPSHPLEPALRHALRLLPPVLLAAAIWVLWREFHHLSLSAVARSMEAWGATAIGIAIVFSVVSFVLMGVIEWVGLRWAGARVPWGATLGTSFMANAIAHSIGANLLVSGAIRARLYDRYGVGLTQVAATTLFAGFSFAVGLAALSGGGLMLAPAREIGATALSLPVARTLGAGLLTFAFGYIVLCAVRRRPLTAFGRSLTLPSARDALTQMVVGVADNGIAAAIIWILLPAGSTGYGGFVGAYAVACIAGLLSSVPGGAGVFESALATLLPKVGIAPLAAAFLGYRIIYYIAPLILASLALAADTLRRRGRI